MGDGPAQHVRALTFLKFLREIRKDGPADLDWIQKQGLLAVKLTQIFALRPDMLSIEKCIPVSYTHLTLPTKA